MNSASSLTQIIPLGSNSTENSTASSIILEGRASPNVLDFPHWDSLSFDAKLPNNSPSTFSQADLLLGPVVLTEKIQERVATVQASLQTPHSLVLAPEQGNLFEKSATFVVIKPSKSFAKKHFLDSERYSVMYLDISNKPTFFPLPKGYKPARKNDLPEQVGEVGLVCLEPETLSPNGRILLRVTSEGLSLVAFAPQAGDLRVSPVQDGQELAHFLLKKEYIFPDVVQMTVATDNRGYQLQTLLRWQDSRDRADQWVGALWAHTIIYDLVNERSLTFEGSVQVPFTLSSSNQLNSRLLWTQRESFTGGEKSAPLVIGYYWGEQWLMLLWDPAFVPESAEDETLNLYQAKIEEHGQIVTIDCPDDGIHFWAFVFTLPQEKNPQRPLSTIEDPYHTTMIGIDEQGCTYRVQKVATEGGHWYALSGPLQPRPPIII